MGKEKETENEGSALDVCCLFDVGRFPLCGIRCPTFIFYKIQYRMGINLQAIN